MALVKFNTDETLDTYIDWCKDHFGQTTASKACISATVQFQMIHDKAESLFLENARLKRLLSEARAALQLKIDADFNIARSLEDISDYLEKD